MSNLFNLDNPIFVTLSKACDVLLLSLVWIILCLPIVTIGPATTAMYYATVKVIRRERGYLMREFFKSFKLNFKKGVLIGLLFILLYAVVGFDLLWAWENLKNSVKMGSVLYGVFLAIMILISCIAIYIFPILSRFDMTIKQMVKASAYMAIRHLPSTILMLIITAVGVFSIYLLFITIVIIPAIVVLLNSLLMERIFKRYMPKAEETSEDSTKKDEWYLE